MKNQTVAILGASDNPDRYAYLALKMLQDYGHKPLPVNPTLKAIEGLPVSATLGELKEPVHTLTMYLGAARSNKLIEDIVKLKPGRVIFNPGSENPALEARLREAGLPFEHACTLVLLRTGQF